MRALLATTAFVGVFGVVTGYAQAQSIAIGIGSEPSTLDPQLRDDGGERQVNDNIYEALLARTPQGDIVPGLALDLPTQIDDTTWEFALREGISFHNGEPFNADAVVASIERAVDPENASEQLAYFGTVTGAEKVDDFTVRVFTDGPDPALPSRMYWMKMVPPVHAAEGDIAEEPVGTGPYKFVSWDRGSTITLEANEDYWDGAPDIEDVTIRFIVEPGTRLSGLMAGELDVIVYLLPEFAASVPQHAVVGGLETSVIILATDNDATSDPRVRQALNYAIDRQTLADSLFLGFADVAKGQLIHPEAFGYNTSLESYPYDPERARELIAEAGAEGTTIELMGTSGRWLKDRELVEAIGAYWSEIGLNVDVQIEEFSAYLRRLFDMNTRPDAYFVLNSNELLDADREMSFAYEAGLGGASNSDADLTAMIVEARSEADLERRAELYDEITTMVHEQAYDVPLFNHQDIYGMSERMIWQPRTDAKLIINEMSVNQ
ncbi:ABC transporter substrate-binding protein [Pelagibacterium lacus]|uniref:ABC transporter substrate-binding protein n=2 Tax=Pelagibacterium lacus TaxID=2282655 RepID=A0A369WA49_9HYPH|nr:ABC transporter substrate-binding protein [Pelagibacterium lacus]